MSTALYGDPRLPKRFWSKVQPCPMSGCWRWVGAVNSHGYGRYFGGRDARPRVPMAHRAAYEALVGPIADSLPLDHVAARGCVTRACVNPDHLEPVTQRENLRRGRGAAVTSERHRAQAACVHGHTFTEDNTYFDPSNGKRRCRICCRTRALRYYHEGKAKAS